MPYPGDGTYNEAVKHHQPIDYMVSYAEQEQYRYDTLPLSRSDIFYDLKVHDFADNYRKVGSVFETTPTFAGPSDWTKAGLTAFLAPAAPSVTVWNTPEGPLTLLLSTATAVVPPLVAAGPETAVVVGLLAAATYTISTVTPDPPQPQPKTAAESDLITSINEQTQIDQTPAGSTPPVFDPGVARIGPNLKTVLQNGLTLDQIWNGAAGQLSYKVINGTHNWMQNWQFDEYDALGKTDSPIWPLEFPGDPTIWIFVWEVNPPPTPVS
jgi:hypothetical protein